MLLCKWRCSRLLALGRRRLCAAAAESEAAESKWQVWATVCVERQAVVGAAPTPVEVDFQAMLDREHDERSLLSQHELALIRDLKAKEKHAEKEGTAVVGELQTQVLEDSWKALAQQFESAPRTTDEEADEKSLNRCLERKLVLLVQQAALGVVGPWRLPKVLLHDDENLRQAAERLLGSLFPQDAFVINGNAPFSYYGYKYPKPVRDRTHALGAKEFFMQAELRPRVWHRDSVKSVARPQSATIADYAWLPHSQLASRIDHLRYHRALARMLIE